MNKDKLSNAKIQEKCETNGNVPTNLENKEADDFVSEDEEVLSAQITKYLEITNQDDYAPSDIQPYWRFRQCLPFSIDNIKR